MADRSVARDKRCGPPEGDRRDGHKGTVLVAAPHEGLCRMLARCVASLGHQAVAATDGGAAIRLCGLHDPDLVIFMENMPGMRATNFLDAGLDRLLARRVLVVERRTAGMPRRLPTIEFPMDAGKLVHKLRGWLTVSDCC